MKCLVLHESDTRIRIRIPKLSMSLRQADLLEYYLKDIPGVKKVSVDERTGNAVIVFSDNKAEKRQMLNQALRDYDEISEKVAALVPEETGRALNREYEERLLCKILTHNLAKWFLPMPVRRIWTVVKSIPFLWKAVKTTATGGLKVELLDGIAIGTSILRGDYATAASVIFLLDTGEILEEWTRKKSIGDMARAMSLQVDQVWVKNGEQEIRLPIANIRAGDHIIVRSSDIIPLDGKVLQGEMTVNEGECIIKVTKESGKGKYDQIVRMIEESERLKSDTEARAYRLADSLVPYSFAGFAITYGLTRNMTKALSFLMVDYSCAMKLSMPLAVLSAIREAGDYGISIKGGKFMEAISKADTIVFDKTGTLTYATPKLMEVVVFGDNDENEMLRIAACLEEHYPHSVANAIVEGALQRGLHHEELHSKVEYIVAHGVSSFVGDKKVVIGSYHFVMEDEKCSCPIGEEHRLQEIKEEYSRIYLAIDGKLSAILCIFDPVRKEAKGVIKKLHSMGIQNICMMTGDGERTAASIAEALDISDYRAEVLPEDKANYVKKMKEQGHMVIMIGDGINDSPALSEADVGIAIGSGAAIAREIADVTIAATNLNELIILRRISERLMRRIHGNYRFIVGFNSSLIALGLTGLLSPSNSALLHNCSTVFAGMKSTTNLLDIPEK